MHEVVFYVSSAMMVVGVLVGGYAMFRMNRVFKRMEKLDQEQ